jgi:signal peptidase I
MSCLPWGRDKRAQAVYGLLHGDEQPGHQVESLSERQREVLRLMAEGRSNANIAETFGISLDGAKWHVREVLTKLGVGSREEAAEVWRAHNGLPARWSRTFRALTAASLGAWARGAIAAAAASAVGVGAVYVVTHSPGADVAEARSVTARIVLDGTGNPATPSSERQADGGPAEIHHVLNAGTSMAPTLAPDRLLSFVLYGLDAEPKRGEVIVARDPRRESAILVKRVVGLPGETVEIRDGHVLTNDVELNEPYLAIEWHDTKAAVVVPAGEYFVMGDNRNNSLDSRSPQVGTVPRNLILGRVLLPD